MFDKKEESKILDGLQMLGLSEKEAAVYVSLLKLGEGGSSKIIKDAELHGQYVFQGKESCTAHEFEMLEKAPEGSELLVIGGTGDKFNETMAERLGEYVSLQVKKNIRVRYIGSEGQRATMPQMHGRRKLFEARYLPGLFTGQVNTNVWPDSIGFNIFGEPVTRFTIWNPVVAGGYRQFFETLWKLARP